MIVHDELRRAAAHVFVTDIDHPLLDDDDRHHLLRVLRLRHDEVVGVSDGQGAWRLCRHVGDGALDATTEVRLDPRPEPEICVAFAPVKGDRAEWVVQKLTEFGVDRIVPFTSERSVVRWDGERAVKQHVRLCRVAHEAAMQSRRTRLPVVEPLSSFSEVATRSGACLAEPDGGPITLVHPVVLVGPEGGFTPEEHDMCAQRVRLNGGVLRAESAAVAVGVLMNALRSGIVTPPQHP